MKDGEEKWDGKGFAPEEEDLAEELDSLYQKVASLDSPQTSAGIREEGEPKENVPDVGEVPYPQNGDNAQEFTQQASKVNAPSKRRYWILGAVLTIMVAAAVSVHFWPDLYYYETINSGDKIYPLRINKLTASASFYDGKAWVVPPLPDALTRKVSRPLAGISPDRRLPAPDPNPAVTPPAAAAGALSSGAVKKGNEIRPTRPVKEAGEKKNSFSIQIASFKENDEALAWLESMDIKKTDVRVIKVNLQEKGIWHRILLGRFDRREEANRYLETLQRQGKYSGSFIRTDHDLAETTRLGQD